MSLIKTTLPKQPSSPFIRPILLAGLIPWLGLMSVPCAAADFFGVDDFDDNTKDASKWGTDLTLGTTGGQLSETNQALEFTPATNGLAVALRPWILNYGSYTNNWELKAELNIGQVGLNPGDSWMELFLGVGNAGDLQNGMPRDRLVVSLNLDTNEVSKAYAYFTADSADVGDAETYAQSVGTQRLGARLVFNAAAETLTAYYDADGFANGEDWIWLRGVHLGPSGGNWQMNSSSRFMAVLGGRCQGASLLSPHQIFADNFEAWNETDTALALGVAVEATNLSWRTSGDLAWKPQTSVTHDGVDAAQSGAITHSQASFIETTILGTGTLSFWWKVSSESYCDFLWFELNGEYQTNISGEVDWTQQHFDLAAPTNVLHWRYDKDSSVNSGQDKAWLDQVVFTADTPAPRITVQPANQLVAAGASASFTVFARSSSSLTYQWCHNGANLEGATNATLTLANVQTNQAGPYAVVVSNAYGVVTSAVATLTVVDLGRDFFDNFDPEIDLPQWAAFGGTVGTTVLATNYGGSVSGPNALWFGDNGERYATTRFLNTSQGGLIGFQLRLAEGGDSNWEEADLPDEGVVLEYSMDAGSTWTELGRYDTTVYNMWTAVFLGIPTGAQGPSVQFRWRQMSNSGWECDHWALDNVLISTGPTPPLLTVQPANQMVSTGGTATFTMTAVGSGPLFYQWWRDGRLVADATNASLTLANLQTNQSGLAFWAVVSNAYGVVTSAVATLTVVDLGRDFFDDFDPGIDLLQWAAFGGTVGTTVLATNYGGSVSGPNALWFGDGGERYATTRLLNTSAGGLIRFQLRLAQGSDAPWEEADDLPSEGVVLEYSTDAGSTWLELGQYASSTYYNWTAVSLGIPAGAQGPLVQFRWRQMSNSGWDCDHWALDDVLIILEQLPRLSIARVGTNIVLAWPEQHLGSLEQSPLHLPIAWMPVTPPPPMVVSNGLNTVVLPAGPNAQFYRLRMDRSP